MSSTWLDRHRQRLDAAVAAIAVREHHSPYADDIPVRDQEEIAAGRAAFDARLGREFPLTSAGARGTVATERSPYGFDLDIAYPHVRRDPEDVRELVRVVSLGRRAWRSTDRETRIGVCLEIIDRLRARVFEIGYAVKHTTGHPYPIALRAGGGTALDRAVEAVAHAWLELSRIPTAAVAERTVRGQQVRVRREFRIMPRGITLIIAGRTFPTMSTWPGLFASLATGNSVVIKPHPQAVLPLAITVQVCREVLAEAGFDPELVTLAAEAPEDRLAATLAQTPSIGVVEYTGTTPFGEWLEEYAAQAVVLTAKSGTGGVVVDSTDDFAGMCADLAVSIALCSSQICTAPQSIFVPRAGVATDQGRKSPTEVGAGIGAALDELLADEARAADLLGAIADEATLTRLRIAAGLGEILVPSRALSHPLYPDAVVRTPLLALVSVEDAEVYGPERYGPIAFVVETADTEESIAMFHGVARQQGATSAAVYSTSEEVLEEMREATARAGVALSENLTGPVYVTEFTPFADFHCVGANPAGNPTGIPWPNVAARFQVVQTRRQI